MNSHRGLYGGMKIEKQGRPCIPAFVTLGCHLTHRCLQNGITGVIA